MFYQAADLVKHDNMLSRSSGLNSDEEMKTSLSLEYLGSALLASLAGLEMRRLLQCFPQEPRSSLALLGVWDWRYSVTMSRRQSGGRQSIRELI